MLIKYYNEHKSELTPQAKLIYFMVAQMMTIPPYSPYLYPTRVGRKIIDWYFTEKALEVARDRISFARDSSIISAISTLLQVDEDFARRKIIEKNLEWLNKMVLANHLNKKRYEKEIKTIERQKRTREQNRRYYQNRKNKINEV